MLTVVVFYPGERTAVNQEWETHKNPASKKKYFFFQVSVKEDCRCCISRRNREAMQELERRKKIIGGVLLANYCGK